MGDFTPLKLERKKMKLSNEYRAGNCEDWAVRRALIQILQKRGWNPKDLAQFFGVGLVSIYRWKSGQRVSKKYKDKILAMGADK